MSDHAPNGQEIAALPRRIVVAGSTGSGKSTLGRRLSEMSGIPWIELDALHWLPGWTESPPEEFRAKVRAALDRPDWIVDGNYRVVRDLTWGQADEVIWLDYSFPRVLRQLVVRTFSRRARNELLWGTNRERLRDHFITKDSLFLWLIKTHWRHRREYPPQFAECPNLHVTRVRSPRELERHVRHLQALLPIAPDAATATTAG
jgi:adenylate kinase family enzyme